MLQNKQISKIITGIGKKLWVSCMNERKNALLLVYTFKKIIKEIRTLGKAEMRVLVDYYYQIQHYHVQANTRPKL